MIPTVFISREIQGEVREHCICMCVCDTHTHTHSHDVALMASPASGTGHLLQTASPLLGLCSGESGACAHSYVQP